MKDDELGMDGDSSGVGTVSKKHGVSEGVGKFMSGMLSRISGDDSSGTSEAGNVGISIERYLKSDKPLYMFTSGGHITKTKTKLCGEGEALFLFAGASNDVLYIWFGDSLKGKNEIDLMKPHFKINLSKLDDPKNYAIVSVRQFPFMLISYIIDWISKGGVDK